MPVSTTVIPRARARVMISVRFRFIAATGTPRRPSLAPSSITRILTSPSSDQSRRLRPPADVSPDTPALTTSYAVPLGPQPRLDQRRNRFFFRESVACGEAVAEKDDHAAAPRVVRSAACGVSSRTNLGRRLPLRAGGVHQLHVSPIEEATASRIRRRAFIML